MAGPIIGLGESLTARLIPVIAPLLAAVPNEAGQTTTVPVRAFYSGERARWPLVTLRLILGDVRMGAGENMLGPRTAIMGLLDQVWTLSFGGTVTGGTFTLTFPVSGPATTDPISYSLVPAETADHIQSALDALLTMGAGNTVVSALDAVTFTVLAAGTLASASLDNLVVDDSLLEGTTPTLTSTVTTQGGDDKSMLRGMRVSGSQLFLDVLARSDPERYYITDALQAGLLADFTVLTSGAAHEGAVITALRREGFVVTGVARPQFPAPVLGEGRPEGQTYRSSLVVQGDAWFTWTTPGIVLNIDGATLIQEPDADPYGPGVVKHAENTWTVHDP